MKYRDLRKQVIETCLAMNEEGINQGTSGNVSVRTDDGFLITASGIPYKKMKPHHVVEMDLDGGYRGDFLPSTEWRM
ncbi:MAG: class II aldolase, partial [Phyllobacteriaceae bacterium]|nr:class II aldolase [Phyllobacteriaceae bacterium]